MHEWVQDRAGMGQRGAVSCRGNRVSIQLEIGHCRLSGNEKLVLFPLSGYLAFFFKQ